MMIRKSDLVLWGSLLFFITTVLKKHVYFIDLLYNAVGFFMYLFILVYFIWFVVYHHRVEKKLLFSVFLFLLTAGFISFYIFILSFLMYLFVFFVYKSNKSVSNFQDVDIDIYSFSLLVRKNKNFFKIRFLLLVPLFYYLLLFLVIRFIGIGSLHSFF